MIIRGTTKMGIFLASEKTITFLAKFIWGALTNLNIGNTVMDALGYNGGNSASAISAGLKTYALNFQEPLQAVGAAIAMAFFLIQLLELTTQERFTIEFFIKFFGKLVISIALILACKTITEQLWNFGEAFTSLINKNYTTITANTTLGNSSEALKDKLNDNSQEGNSDKQQFIDAAVNEYKDVNTISLILEFGVVGLVLYLMSLILIIVVYIVSFTRVLEMSVRAVFMPIAFALLSDDGWRGAGGRYIKKFIAICAQGAVLILIGEVSSFAILTSMTTVGSNNGNFLMSIVIDLGIAYAGISMMFRSIGIINDVFGA